MDSIYPLVMLIQCALSATLERYIKLAAKDESLKRIIRKALGKARAKGRNYITQTEPAVRVGCQVRPDLTASDVLAMVIRLQQS